MKRQKMFGNFFRFKNFFQRHFQIFEDKPMDGLPSQQKFEKETILLKEKDLLTLHLKNITKRYGFDPDVLYKDIYYRKYRNRYREIEMELGLINRIKSA